MERRCLRSAIDATSEVEIRDRIRDFMIGVFTKPGVSMLRHLATPAYVGYFVKRGGHRKCQI